MKKLLRKYLFSLGALWISSQILPALVIQGELKGLALAALAFMIADIILIPLLKVLFLPLNLLTLGIFAWITNVLALYFLVSVLPELELLPYHFPGIDLAGFIIPPIEMPTFMVAVVASFLIGGIIHILNWLTK